MDLNTAWQMVMWPVCVVIAIILIIATEVEKRNKK
ncbi:hypothetical protein [Escherichia phage vB_EcoP_PAS7]|uniref:Uncharacterized protein n=1 Tax=Escherichia phage vB_EcoP_PAS7 TaxID=3053875 RepID=A0AA51VHB3_9CAUD|nr:hypothetical protein [Escherichia phage vB_EcoP_PAS7]